MKPTTWIYLVPLLYCVHALRTTRNGEASGSGCLPSEPDESFVVHPMKQPHADGTFFVTHEEGAKVPGGHAPLFSLVEALLDGCKPPFRPSAFERPIPWLAEVGTGLDESSALASSLGCSVAAVNPEATTPRVKRRLQADGCLNGKGEHSFVVVPGMATDESGKTVILNGPSDTPVAASNSSAPPSNTTAAAAAAAPSLIHLGRSNHSIGRSNGTGTPVPTVSLDDLFLADGPGGSLVQSEDEKKAMRGGHIGLLKITPHRCCGSSGSLKALQGARKILQNNQVRCLMADMTFEKESTEALIDMLHDLEHLGYGIMQVGPIDSVEIEITSSGSYPVFMTDARQLRELYETLAKIRSFDERSGYRVYDDGLSLDRDGHYFDYTNLVVACQGRPPDNLVVKDKAKLRFKDGTWWPEDPAKGGQ